MSLLVERFVPLFGPSEKGVTVWLDTRELQAKSLPIPADFRRNPWIGYHTSHVCMTSHWHDERSSTNIAMRTVTQHMATQRATTQISPLAAQQFYQSPAMPLRNLRHVFCSAPRRTTFAHGAKEKNIATNMPCWQERNTWPHGGPRAICQDGIRMSTDGRVNRYFRQGRTNRGQGEQRPVWAHLLPVTAGFP